MEDLNSNLAEILEEEEELLELPEKFDTPQIIPLSHSVNISDIECLGGKGASCTWK